MIFRKIATTRYAYSEFAVPGAIICRANLFIPTAEINEYIIFPPEMGGWAQAEVAARIANKMRLSATDTAKMLTVTRQHVHEETEADAPSFIIADIETEDEVRKPTCKWLVAATK